MGLKKLTAGDGYTYLTRQVAAHDATSRGYRSLGEYYADKGEWPGLWMGRGLAGLSDFAQDSPVTEAQMKALFGEGRHPDAVRIEAEMVRAGHGPATILAQTQLGSPFRINDDVNEFRRRCAQLFEEWNSAAGFPRDWPVPSQERARIRTELAREMFDTEYRRPPANARELSGYLAQISRQGTTAVAGYDLTFSPVKSVSALWAVADRRLAQQVERAHHDAVAATLTWLEDNAAYTRAGRNGVQQLDVTGLLAAGFTHRDARSGDPDLHTHVAVSNKVQCANGGRWLALDGRTLHKLAVAASEQYNTRLEGILVDRLGVQFADHPSTTGKRPIREIVGIPEALLQSWSTRRAAIATRRGELATRFQAEHGRPPTAVESLKLAQVATLQTRQAKHEPRSEAEQRATWRAEASQILGGERGVRRIVRTCTGRRRRRSAPAKEWITQAAAQVLCTVEEHRATWQEAHIRAEAERVARSAEIPLSAMDASVDAVVDQVISQHSIALGVREEISDPRILRRRDGSSVYSVAGSQLYTSAAIVAAEKRLLAAAGRRDGRTIPVALVEAALRRSAATVVTLNPGQAHLVQEMATSGARLAQALAPAGTGKTTAMRVLSQAWSYSGGTVIGLAPSAAAATVLGRELGASGAETLAKFLTDMHAAERPEWLADIDRNTLLIVDEASMAGELDLDQVVQYVISRGGSVRFICDDQQLSAIGAGGICRDIAAVHGAVTLSQVMRFADPAEGAASLALRAGDAAAIAYYTDNDRVHVGDAAAVADTAYQAWSADRDQGADAIMLAPTRELVTELNARARADRLAATGTLGPQIRLSDGTEASAGDVIITTRNDRRLSFTGTDWVKNGYRWRIREVQDNGAVLATHLGTGRTVRLPAGYIAEHVRLGYACTVHAAQGVTADIAHLVADDSLIRQLLYVGLTRGRLSNHLHLVTATDGDIHTVTDRDALLPPTAVDLLRRILERAGSAVSATTTQRIAADPTTRLGAAAARYADALGVAAEQVLGTEGLAALDTAAENAYPGLVAAPAYPTLRAHLAIIALNGQDPAQQLQEAIAARPLDDPSDPARDPAAVLDWRLDPTIGHSAQPGPLPWLAGIPDQLRTHQQWGPYLSRRATQVREFADHVRSTALAWTPAQAPAWAEPLVETRRQLTAQVAVWRAATGVDANDYRPTGEQTIRAAEQRIQRRLDAAIDTATHDPLRQRWSRIAGEIDSRITADPYWPQVAARLSTAAHAGIDIAQLLHQAAGQTHLPDEQPAAALWWRLSRSLTPAALNGDGSEANQHQLRPDWTTALTDLVGPEVTERIMADRAWPALVAAVSAHSHDWKPADLLRTAYELLHASHSVDHPVPATEMATALTWRIGLLTTNGIGTPTIIESTENLEHFGTTDHLIDEDWLAHAEPPPEDEPEPPTDPYDGTITANEIAAAPSLAVIPRREKQHTDWDKAPVSRERIIELNTLAAQYFTDHYRDAWAADYLTERLGTDLHSDSRFTPGYAPAGWTDLTTHLQRTGATETELLEAGLCTLTRNGRLIDRFRDRLILPIYANGEIHGFTARRNPHIDSDPDAGPKYLNTPDTKLFHKGETLFGLSQTADLIDQGATPVLVEGALDAIATTLAGSDTYVGVAPMGTAFTDHQADLLRPYLTNSGPGIIVATDPDLAGRKAAHRAFWQLAARGGDPRYLRPADGSDPAEILQHQGQDQLLVALRSAQPLASQLITDHLAAYNLRTIEGRVYAARAATGVIALLPPQEWTTYIATLSERLDIGASLLQQELLDAADAFNTDPTGILSQRLSTNLLDTAFTSEGPAKWASLVAAIEPRLLDDANLPILTTALDEITAVGHDPAEILSRLTAEPLPASAPARTLAYRLADVYPDNITTADPETQHRSQQAITSAAGERLTNEARHSDNAAATHTSPTEKPKQPERPAPSAPQVSSPNQALEQGRNQAP